MVRPEGRLAETDAPTVTGATPSHGDTDSETEVAVYERAVNRSGALPIGKGLLPLIDFEDPSIPSTVV
jgi:hypothetical protein